MTTKTKRDLKAATAQAAADAGVTLIPAEAVAALPDGAASPLAALMAVAKPKAVPAKARLTFVDPVEIGHGCYVQRQGDMLLLAINIGDEARSYATPSSTGALCLLANTGGFKALDGLGVKLNVVAGFTNPNKPQVSKQRVRER